MTDGIAGIVMRLCDAVYKLCDKLDDFASGIEVDEAVLETVPRKYAEKKRETAKPLEGVFDVFPFKNLEAAEDRIKVHAVLDGFDKKCLKRAKRRIIEAGKFITGSAGTRLERKLAAQLAGMLWKGAVTLTDTYLTGNERFGGYFQPPGPNNHAYIGLDITTIMKNNDACLVNNLVHETYHAWRYYTGDKEYSIIDETRAWNTALHFSNKYRAIRGLKIERHNDYTIEELMEKGAEYNNALNVNIRYGPGEHWIEKVGYGIANLMEDAADTIDGWTDKVMDKTFSD
jgi:hypothetical protein